MRLTCALSQGRFTPALVESDQLFSSNKTSVYPIFYPILGRASRWCSQGHSVTCTFLVTSPLF